MAADEVPTERQIVRQKERMERQYVKERSRLGEMVNAYLENGGSPTKLGREFDPPLTRGRVYQMRAAWLKEQGR